MRVILVFTILLVGLTGAAPEPKYSLRVDDLRVSRDLLDGLIEIESSTQRGDRLSLAALGPHVLRVEVLRREDREVPLHLASLNFEFGELSDGGDDRGSVDTQVDTPTARCSRQRSIICATPCSPRPRTTTYRFRFSPTCSGRRAGCASMT